MAIIGAIAAMCTTGAFIPQILKIRKQGGDDLSYSMLAVYLAGVLLWLTYGLMFRAPAVIWANLVASILVIVTLVLKLIGKGPGVIRGSDHRIYRPRLAVDMDEVIADSLLHHLTLYNQTTGESLTPETIREMGLERAIPEKYRQVFERLPHEDGFFNDLAVIPNSQRALQLLSSRFDVFITSAAMEVPGSFDAKFQWLQEHFPFISPSHIVFCGDKEIIDADYLIDDQPRHFERFRGAGILFAAPHNAHIRAPSRVNNWDEVLARLMEKESVAGSQPAYSGMPNFRTNVDNSR